MGKASAWLGTTMGLSAWTGDASKSNDFARVINEDTTSITITRGASTLAAQTVRIETMARGESYFDLNGRQHQVDAIVFGFKGHATITDTNIQVLDRFPHEGRRYEVIAVLVDLENVVQAICEAKN